MNINRFRKVLPAAAAVFMAGAAFGQIDIQLQARHLPGWDARSREGRCTIRVWVDNRAEVRLRGEGILCAPSKAPKAAMKERVQPAAPLQRGGRFPNPSDRGTQPRLWRRNPAA